MSPRVHLRFSDTAPPYVTSGAKHFKHLITFVTFPTSFPSQPPGQIDMLFGLPGRFKSLAIFVEF